MSEIDIIRNYIPDITEMIKIYRKMSYEKYQSCKVQTLEMIDNRAKPFMERVFALMEYIVDGDSENIVIAHLSVNDNTNVEDIESVLKIEEE